METSEPNLTEEQGQQLLTLENYLRTRMKNAILFSAFGEQRIDQREIDTMKELLSEAMRKFGCTLEQIAGTMERLSVEATKQADEGRK